MKLEISRYILHKRKYCRDALLAMPQKCGEWPFSFATIVANEKILLDIAEL